MARARRRREAGFILLASLAAHGVLLIWLIKSMHRPQPMAAATPFQVSLVPELRRAEAQAPHPTSAPSPPASAKTGRGAETTHPIAATPPEQAKDIAPVAPPPAAATSAAGSAPPIGAGPGPDAEAQAAVRRALRATLGCAHPDFAALTSAERDDCSRQAGHQAAIGAQENLERVPEEKRVYYAKVQKAYQDIRNYVGLSGVPIPGHGPGIGCRLPFGIPKGWKPTRHPHSLKLGPLPCYLVPPTGLLTPEADIPAP